MTQQNQEVHQIDAAVAVDVAGHDGFAERVARVRLARLGGTAVSTDADIATIGERFEPISTPLPQSEPLPIPDRFFLPMA